MIVGETFVWAHVPKTAGDATVRMIRQVPRLVVMADHPGDHAKHVALDLRRGSIQGKRLVANVRRLPDWAFSYMRHRERFGLWPDYEPQGPRSADVVAAESAADAWLDQIVGGYEIDFWIRQEHLADDLVRFLRETAALTDEEEAAIRSVGRVNDQRPRRLQRLRRGTPERFFSAAQVEALYASNPRWAAVERAVYD
ncbi:MAG TPA: hypothetical protein VF529_06485 [Solirubrobacteraceae bacterium]